jgi:hypothetical protein
VTPRRQAANARLDTTLAPDQLLAYAAFHVKSSLIGADELIKTSSNTQESRRISGLQNNFLAPLRTHSLVSGPGLKLVKDSCERDGPNLLCQVERVFPSVDDEQASELQVRQGGSH